MLVKRRLKYEAVAISGTDSFNRRSNSVRLMERVTAVALALGNELWYPTTEEYLPQIKEHLDAYLDEFNPWVSIPGRVRLDPVAFQMACPAFSHLAAAGVPGT